MATKQSAKATNRTGKTASQSGKATAPTGKSTARTGKAGTAASGQRSAAAEQAAPGPRERARSLAESAVDLPVGAVLEVTDRVGELVEPFATRASARKRLGSYRTQLRRNVKRTERRGAAARRKATTEARRTIDRQTSRAQELADQLRA